MHDDRLHGRQVVELVGEAWREASLGAEALHHRPEAPSRCVAAREDQRLRLEVCDADCIASRELVALWEHHVEMVCEQAAALQARSLGDRQLGHVVDHGEVDVAAAEPLDRLVRLELVDLYDELGMRAAQVAHRRRHEGRQGAGEGGEAQNALRTRRPGLQAGLAGSRNMLVAHG